MSETRLCAYKLWNSGEEGYVFGANSAYFKGRPRVQRLEVSIINQDQRAYRALRRSDIDMLPMSLPEDLAEGLGDALGINVRRGPSYAGTALLLNLRRPRKGAARGGQVIALEHRVGGPSRGGVDVAPGRRQRPARRS